MQENRGICPFYKHKFTDNGEVLSCQVTGEYIHVKDDKSLLKVASGIDETCLGFDYIGCKYYKMMINEQR
jgi:hypothetical protein